jgi:hypothetical protein
VTTGSTTQTFSETTRILETTTQFAYSTFTASVTPTVTKTEFGIGALTQSSSFPFVIGALVLVVLAVGGVAVKRGLLSMPNLKFGGGGQPPPGGQPQPYNFMPDLASQTTVPLQEMPPTTPSNLGDPSHLTATNPQSTVLCPRCSAPNASGATVCGTCDRPLPTPVTGPTDTDIEGEDRLGKLVSLEDAKGN